MPENTETLGAMLRRTTRPNPTLQDIAYQNTSTVNYAQANAERYPTYFIGADNEEIYGQNQSVASKWGSGLVKGLGLTATTFVGGTVGLVNGVFQAVSDGDFNSFYDNELNKSLNDFNALMEDRYANYYTNAERNAAWYSPDTWLTANFWSDTILKNMGFAAGAYLSGKALTGIGTSLLGAVRTGVSSSTAAINAAVESGSVIDDIGLLSSRGVSLTGSAAAESQALSRATVNEARKAWLKNVVHSTLSAAGEAQIEAYHAKDGYKTQMIEEFRRSIGRDPNDQELQNIDDTASEIGNATFAGNMAILTATNFIQFPKLAKTARAEARVVGQAERDFFTNVVDKDGNVINRAWSRGSNIAPNTVAGERLVTSTGTNFIGNQLDRFSLGRVLNKVSPYARVIFSPSEAIEEGTQTLIPNLAEAYFAEGSETKGDITSSFKKSVASTLDSKDFWISVLSGGLTGGLMENLNPFNGGLIQPIRNRNETQRKANEFVNTINASQLGGYGIAIAEGQARTEAADRRAKEAVLSGDNLSLQDALTDQRYAYLAPRIQYGRKDLVDADINNWSNLAQTESGWNQLQEQKLIEDGVTRQEFISGLDKMRDMSSTISAQFEALNYRYANSKNEQGQLTHNKDVLYKMAYVATKIDDYNKRINDVSAELGARGISADSLTYFLNQGRTQTDAELQLPLTLPDGTPYNFVDDSPLSKAAAVEAYIESANKVLTNNSSWTQDQIDQAMDDLGDIVGMVANRQQFIEEYKRIRENPEQYQDTTEEPTDYVDEEEMDEDLGAPLPNSPLTAKKEFFKVHQGQEVTLDFGQRGSETGTLVYDENSNILAVQKPDNSLYEITNQDFRDGLVRFTDPAIQVEQEFLDELDPRTDLKRQETIRNIRESLQQQQEKLDTSRAKVSTIKEKISRIQDSIQNSSSESTKTLSNLQKERYDKLLKVQNSSQAAKLRNQYLNGEISNEELNQELKNLQEKEGIPAIEQRLKELDTAFSSYDDMGKSVEELTTIHDDLQQELTDLDNEQVETERQIAIYNELLANPFSDYNKVLNEIEQQLFQLAGLRDDLNQHRRGIERVIKDVKTAIVSFTKLLKGKAQLSNIPAAGLISRAADYVISTIDNQSISPDFRNSLRDITSKLSLSEAQKGKLNSDLNSINTELNNVDQDIESRLQVYEQLLERALLINNPLDPAHFSDTIEEQPELPEDEEVTDEATNELRADFNGTKKLLNRLFKSTVVLPDMRVENTPAWYRKYGKALKNIAILPWSDRQNLRVRVVSARNESSVGLTGLIDSVTNGYHKTEASKLDPNDGTILAVLSKVRPDGSEVFLDENLNELSNPTIDTVVVTKLANTELNFRNSKEENYAKPEQVPATPQEVAMGYMQLRTEILSENEVRRSHPFTISRGQLPDPSNKDIQIVGNLVNIEDLSSKPLLRLVKKGQTYETTDGDTFSPQKGSVLLLDLEGSAQPVYVSYINNDLAQGIIKALEHISVNMAENQGYDNRMMAFVDAMLPYGTRFDKVNMTLTKGKEIINLKDLNFSENLLPLLLKSKVRTDIPMMTAFSEVTDVGIVHWDTFQEFLLNNSDRVPHVYTKEAKYDKQHRYLILQNFYDVGQASVISDQTGEVETVQEPVTNPIESLLESIPVENKEDLRSFIDEISNEPNAVEDMLDIDNEINKTDC